MTKTILIFDTETTGLIPKNIDKVDINNLPCVVQMSWIIFDLELKKKIKTKDYIIKVNSHIANFEIHGINDLISQEKGVEIGFVLKDFICDMNEVDLLVAHNYSFDSKMIEIELSRLKRNLEIKFFKKKDYYCSMMATIEFCKLESKFFRSFKFPRLQELHVKLFDFEFIGAHNSLADVNATLKCYLKFVHDIDIDQ
jgi:DNA polymerase III alpha subunit (gram-positive type)